MPTLLSPEPVNPGLASEQLRREADAEPEDDVNYGFDDEELGRGADSEKEEQETIDTPQKPQRQPTASSNQETPKSRSTFGEDIQEWVSHVSETFHVRIFLLETFGQLAFSLLGPLSLPVLYFLYGGRHGLRNRGFSPECNGTFISQTIQWAMLFVALLLWLIFNPANLSTVELKFSLMSLFMRNITISIKYAYMTTPFWKSLRKQQTVDQLRMPLMFSWYLLTPDNMKMQADISFIGIIGSRKQRSELRLQFLGWPSALEELDEFRSRVDMTSKTLYHVPAGEVSGARSRFRKAGVKTPVATTEFSMRPRPSLSVDFGACELAMQGRRSMTAEDADALIYKAAAAGKKVPIEDLFMYILRGVLRSEAVHLPQGRFLVLVFLFALFITLLPSILRAKQGLGFFGGSWQSTTVVCLLVPGSVSSYFSVLMFIAAGAKDFWRRRALMRSCAALLSIQRYYRRNSPAEVDQLPPLEFMDVNTVEAWRKLRQLCQDWGRFFFNRVQAFATMFFICTLVVVGDLVLSMEWETYRSWNDVSVVHLAVAGLQAMSVLACIIVLVYLGHEVNESAPRHVFLLQRQRTLLTSRRHRSAIAAEDRGEAPSEREDRKLERIADFVDVICDDISTEHQVRPIRLLGLYCGFSLLSALYFIPAGTLTSVVRFSSNQDVSLRWF